MSLSGILRLNATLYNDMQLSGSTRQFSQHHSIHETGMPNAMRGNLTY